MRRAGAMRKEPVTNNVERFGSGLCGLLALTFSHPKPLGLSMLVCISLASPSPFFFLLLSVFFTAASPSPSLPYKLRDTTRERARERIGDVRILLRIILGVNGGTGHCLG